MHQVAIGCDRNSRNPLTLHRIETPACLENPNRLWHNPHNPKRLLSHFSLNQNTAEAQLFARRRLASITLLGQEPIVFTARRNDSRIPHSPKRLRGDGFSGESVPALTLGVIRPPVKIPLEIVSACRNVGQASACGGL